MAVCKMTKKKIAPMKKASNVARGKAIEKYVADALRGGGFIVDVRPRVKYQSLDFFKLFDIVAITPTRNRLLYIQVKRNSLRTPKETRQTIGDFKMPDNCQKIIMIWRDESQDWIVEYFVPSLHFEHWQIERFRCETEGLVEQYFYRIY